MSKFGGGGAKCTICQKTAYPAETIQFEKLPYHVECFRCKTCDKKMDASQANKFEESIYCKQCFQKGGFAQKQRNVKWVKKEGTGAAIASKFGGGGNPCTICSKTVYAAEQVSFEKKIYHPECFKCAIESCGKKMTASNAAAFEDKVYCKKCFQEHGFARKQASTAKKAGATKSNAIASRFGGGGVKCPQCDKTVYSAEAVSFEKIQYHAQCFVCSEDGCGKKMTPSSAAAFEGRLICTKCFTDKGYNRKQAKTTTKTTGASTNALASKFGGGGNPCYVCAKTVYPAEQLSFEKNIFHADCFKCQNCSNKLNLNSAEGKKKEDGGVDVYCKKCWQDLGLHLAAKNLS